MEAGNLMRGALGLTMAVLTGVAGCGGGGGSSGNPTSVGGSGTSSWTAGVFQPASSFAAQCTAPRSGIDPDTGEPYPDRQGTRDDENNWLRSWSNDLYLWYDEIVDRDPALYSTPAYFDLLKTTAVTASGRPKDRFHFLMPTEEWRQLSQSGTSAGYGVAWALLATTPPRDVRVAFTEPGSPAAQPPIDLARGARVLEIDGVDAVNDNTEAGVDALNAGLFPAQTGESHTFTIVDSGSASSRTVTMTSATVTSAPVQNVRTIDTEGGRFGYLLFNDHLATAEQGLIDAFETLEAAAIDDLVLDMRYNGGGYLVIASQLAYMIAGANRTAGLAFETTRFNSKHPTRDPVTGAAIEPIPFVDETVGLSAPRGRALPSLDLGRVFILTGGDTCSASESVINALRGIDFEVILIGATTCGKPFGFYPTDNCGTTYFSIQFKGENALGFGDYADGFTPNDNAEPPIGTTVTGCYVEDDFDHALGDQAERRLAVALAYDRDACPVGTAAALSVEAPQPGRSGYLVAKPDALRGKIL